MHLNGLVSKLKCPISGKIFNSPVLANDGAVYEECELLEHIFEGNNKNFSLEYTKIGPISSLITYLLKKYPELDEEVYKEDKMKYKDSFIFILPRINIELKRGNYGILQEFKGIFLGALSSQTVFDIINNGTIDTVKHVAKQIQDINKLIYHNKWSLLNWCMKNSYSERIYILLEHSKDIDVNSVCLDDGWSACQQLFKYGHNLNLVKKMVDMGMDLTLKNKKGGTPLYQCFSTSNIEIIEYIYDIAKEKNLMTKDTLEIIINGIYRNKHLPTDKKETLVNKVLST